MLENSVTDVRVFEKNVNVKLEVQSVCENHLLAFYVLIQSADSFVPPLVGQDFRASMLSLCE
jgi:hypothetical protein